MRLTLLQRVVLVLVCVHAPLLVADDSCLRQAARITTIQGTVEIQRNNVLEWLQAKLNDSVCVGDSLRTGSRSRATLQVQKETFMQLNEHSSLRFTDTEQSASTVFSQLMELFSGEAYLRSRRNRELGIGTPFVNVMHEGTEFLVKVNQTNTQVVVFDGLVVASNSLGKVKIAEGQSSTTEKNQAPVIGPRIKLRNAVQWTLYYPPVIDYTANRLTVLKPALDRLQTNDLVGTFELLDKISESEQNADYQTVYASLLLMVGHVEEAQKHLNQVQKSDKQYPNALALESMIALTKNHQQQALKLAQQAQQLDLNASAPLIALSYAYQSLFDTEKALKLSRQAVTIDPDNGLAWARVSEMELAAGNMDASIDAARKAQSINPDFAKTNTILGFARLTALNLSEAEQSFRIATQRDPSDPLARLGLGLAKIRQGQIKSGTKDIETAVNLDPDNALIRSYLGKAYYEQRRGSIASTEYGIAKQLDPNDPTPWFYDAIQKQTTNKPIEALHDMQKAIELNDHRAVYRSKLLLDQDLAARSASLGRIYNDLGFQQLGLIEGWKSVNVDPGNYSAHRLLADNYASLPNHEIARVSELLQSQLLQPINLTPIQPRLAETNILLLDSLGPGSIGFNEFNPIFTRNRLAFQANGIVGSHNTWGEEVTQSGVWNNFSYSLGQLHFETDGFRTNNNLDKDTYNAFVQTRLPTNTSIQLEYRYNKSTEGDGFFRFDRLDYSPDFKQKNKDHFIRFGLNHALSASSTILGSVSYRSAEFKVSDLSSIPIPPFIPGIGPPGSIVSSQNTKTRQNGVLAEFQHLYQYDKLNSVTGGGYYYAKDNGRTLNTPDPLAVSALELNSLPPALQPLLAVITNPLEIRLKGKIKHWNAYNYSKFQILPTLNLTLGLSADFLSEKNANLNTDKINPKVGLIWNPTESTLIRLAAFKSLKRTLTSNQTIEPTQVAGFNQFFDDLNGTSAWRFGAAVNQQVSKYLTTGLELSTRQLDVPIPDSDSWKDKRGKGYIFWTPLKQLAFSVSGEYEGLDRDKDNLTRITTLKTWRVPLKLSYYNSLGMLFRASATYIDQTGKFNSISTPRGSDSFWIFDTNLGYRLPNRHGLITFGIQNLFNTKFQLQQATNPTRSTTPLYSPERFFIARIILSL